MEWRCFECGAPLTRKKCEYCGVRNNRVKEGSVAEVPEESHKWDEKEKDGCSDGCAEGCVSGCAEGCLRLVGELLIEAISNLFG